jgi:hypothetical protein
MPSENISRLFFTGVKTLWGYKTVFIFDEYERAKTILSEWYLDTGRGRRALWWIRKGQELLLICIKLLWSVYPFVKTLHTGFYPLIYYHSFYSKEYIWIVPRMSPGSTAPKALTDEQSPSPLSIQPKQQFYHVPKKNIFSSSKIRTLSTLTVPLPKYLDNWTQIFL